MIEVAHRLPELRAAALKSSTLIRAVAFVVVLTGLLLDARLNSAKTLGLILLAAVCSQVEGFATLAKQADHESEFPRLHPQPI
ncbi:MAG: hypothetical protein LAP87_16775 [Acidobacteriia bacterium]|nr:hypothetical protein [Terriglobia bacterium]